MGLNFRAGDARWSYSGFNRFRTKLASQIGINLNAMEGFKEGGGGMPWSKVEDNIVLLLQHSDCDGELTVKECKRVWPRLEELIKYWEENDYDKINALRLIEDMKGTIKKKEPLEFR